MITLALQDGMILRFNLKDVTREKALRDAWYSMQDIKSYQTRKLKIRTDKQISYTYEIQQIKDCAYEDKPFLYDLPAVENPKPAAPIDPPASPESLFRSLISDPGRFKSAIEKVMDGIQEMFESIPEEYKENLGIFIEKLKDQNIPIEVFSQESMTVITKAMTGHEYLMDQYVEEYKRLWNEHKNI